MLMFSMHNFYSEISDGQNIEKVHDIKIMSNHFERTEIWTTFQLFISRYISDLLISYTTLGHVYIQGPDTVRSDLRHLGDLPLQSVDCYYHKTI